MSKNPKKLDIDIEFYFQKGNRISNIYYDFWKKNGKKSQILNFLKNKKDHYLANYVLVKEFHKNLQPFQFLKIDDNVIQVGFHDQYITDGISHPFIMSNLLENGRIWAIDPDPTNINSCNEYAKFHKIKNIKPIKSGVWENPGIKKFVFFSDYTSSNTVSSVFERGRQSREKRWGKKRIIEKSRTVSVRMDTLDNIVSKKIKSKINFINLTVNGAESNVLKGAQRLLSKNPDIKIGFPLGNINLFGLEILKNLEYKITIVDAHHRPWETEQFFYACAIKEPHSVLKKMGFKKVNLKSYSDTDDRLGYKFVVKEK